MNLQALRVRHLPAGSLGGGEGCGSRRGAGPGRAVRGGCAGDARAGAAAAPALRRLPTFRIPVRHQTSPGINEVFSQVVPWRAAPTGCRQPQQEA